MITSQVHISGKSKKDKGNENDSISGSVSSLSTPGSGPFQQRRHVSGQSAGEADPGVISEDEDEFAFDNLSNKSSASSINVKPRNTQHLPPPPSPLAVQSNTSHSAVSASNDDDIKFRTKVASTPIKPPRTSNEAPEVDEWEQKLYGKNSDLNLTVSDPMKRLSWDARVPLNKSDDTSDDSTPDRNSYQQSVTAPTSPVLHDQKSHEREQINEKPQPLPRSGTLESIVEKHHESPPPVMEKEKKEKSEKRFSNKLKYFRKDKSESHDDSGRSAPIIKHGLGQQKQFGERIIIGHENEHLLIGGHKSIEVPQDILKKYEGKSREEIMLLANDLENEVRLQKSKMKEMEEYLDDLLLRVMETQPKLLQNPYRSQTSTKR